MQYIVRTIEVVQKEYLVDADSIPDAMYEAAAYMHGGETDDTYTLGELVQSVEVADR